MIDAGEDEGRPYIVFEYVEGETLKERIRRVGRLPIAEAVAYAIEIARALGAAHARHIVHRDVKPQNVLIDEEGSAKVTDFGIARTLDEEGLTADGRVLGTTDYVSPEQALGQPVTGQSDLYSLGVVLFEMLSGQVPFKGENQVAVAMKHVREELPDIQRLRPEVSAALAAVVDRATAKRLEDRYANDAELIADLEDVLAIETARAGSATGEVTAVLRTLPVGHAAPRPVPGAPPGVRRAGAGDRAARDRWRGRVARHQDPPRHRALPSPRRRSGALQPVSLCQSCAQGFNPLGNPIDEAPNAGLAIDNQPNTAWDTQHYYDQKLNKSGTGIYLNASPGVAARELRILDATPGFTAVVYARNDTPPLKAPPGNGWTPVSSPTVVGKSTTVPLDTAEHRPTSTTCSGSPASAAISSCRSTS